MESQNNPGSHLRSLQLEKIVYVYIELSLNSLNYLLNMSSENLRVSLWVPIYEIRFSFSKDSGIPSQGVLWILWHVPPAPAPAFRGSRRAQGPPRDGHGVVKSQSARRCWELNEDKAHSLEDVVRKSHRISLTCVSFRMF